MASQPNNAPRVSCVVIELKPDRTPPPAPEHLESFDSVGQANELAKQKSIEEKKPYGVFVCEAIWEAELVAKQTYKRSG